MLQVIEQVFYCKSDIRLSLQECEVRMIDLYEIDVDVWATTL